MSDARESIVLGTCGRLGAPKEELPVGTYRAESAPNAAERIRRLEKVNAALIRRAERVTENQADAYALFQAAILLENQVQKRTEELLAAKHRLEKSNREILKAKEAAEIANRSKSKFLTAAGHDLLQPLNAARLLVSAAAETPLPNETIDVVRPLFAQIDRALETIGDLIKSVLDVAKLDAGVMVPEAIPTSLRALLAEVASDFAPLAAQKHLRLALRCPDAAICSDPMLLKRILSNLVANAVRYTRKGGVLIGARRRGSAIRIDVVDTGIGIAADQSAMIFEEFRRGPAHADDSLASDGLGLGLAIVRRMTQALDLELSFRSIEGRGSVFSLLVPLAGAGSIEMADKRGASSHADRLAEARLLLIENDRQIVEAMTVLMARWHCPLSVATDIASSLAALGGPNPPNIIIADYHLDNGLCGLDVIDAIRRLGKDLPRRDMPGRDMPAIVATADHSPMVEASVKDKGLLLLRKPIKPAELRALITYLLDQGKRTPESV